ncbi:MAG: hypothetical protein WCL50_04695 [Spirochaetota bacterium]
MTFGFARVAFMLAAAFVLALSSDAAGTPAPSFPFLPGLTSSDDHPRGCVDCHIDAGEGRDYRLNKTVNAIKNHPSITTAFKNANIPDSCLLCHKEGSKLGFLGKNLHRAHYANLLKSRFVSDYQGSCLNCHKLDLSTGAMNLKSGSANW